MTAPGAGGRAGPGRAFRGDSGSIYTWISPFPGSGQRSAGQDRFIINQFNHFPVQLIITFLQLLEFGEGIPLRSREPDLLLIIFVIFRRFVMIC